MASKSMMMFLIVLYFFSSHASISNTSVSVDIQDKNGEDNGMELDNGLRTGGAKGIAHHSAYSHGARGRGNGGRSGGRSEGGNGGGGTTSPRTPGGAAVIPLYGAAGAANNQKSHRNAGESYQSSTGLIATLGAIIVASLFNCI